MDALTYLAIIITGSANGSNITPEQAAKSAMAFFKIVGVQQPYSLASSKFDDHAYKRIYGVPCYVVGLKRGGSKVLVSAVLDATNGEVVYAFDSLYRNSDQLGDSAYTGRWMTDLGYRVARTTPGRYTARIGDYRFFNLNGFTAATWMTNKGHFSFFNGFGASPGLPSGKPKIDASQAKRIAIAERKKHTPNWPEKLEARSELGLFYDQQKAQTTWAWKIVEGFVSSNGFSDVFTQYVDAASGKPIEDQNIQSSAYAYHSRRSCPTLTVGKDATVDSNLYRLAKARLADIGRSDVAFQSIEIDKGIRMSSQKGEALEVGPTGQLIRFTASAAPGVLDFAAASKKGEFLIKKLHPKLPEGRFRTERSRLGKYSAVIYGQATLGYEYLESEVVSVHLNQAGKVRAYTACAPMPRPDGIPSSILSTSQLEAMAEKLIQAKLPASTPNVTYSAVAKAGKTGWYFVKSLGKTRLCRAMAIGSKRDIKNYAVQGGWGSYHMDVETGKVYDWR